MKFFYWIVVCFSLLLKIAQLCDSISLQDSCMDIGMIRLREGESSREGRVEICLNNEWGTVCEHDWETADATVVCRQLGFSDRGAQALGDGNFPRGNGIIHGGDYHCLGGEKRLLDCRNNTRLCQQDDNAAVRCRRANCKTGDLRLKDGHKSGLSGRVEICVQEQWGTVCDDYWGSSEAAVVCKQLNYSSKGAIPISFGSFGRAKIDPIHFSNVQCSGTENVLMACWHSSQHMCSHGEDAGVICKTECRNGDVQLVNSYGVASQQGRVEICLDQRWNNVCDEWWTEKDASVVCKQLGYTGYKTIDTTTLGPYKRSSGLSGSIMFKNVNCTGIETKLTDCQVNNQIKTQNHAVPCRSVGVQCSSESRSTTDIQTASMSTEVYIPWIIVGISAGLLLSIILLNLTCIIVIFTRFKKSSRSKPEIPYQKSQSTMVEYENNSAHQDLTSERPLKVENNPSYNAAAHEDCERPFKIENNPSYDAVSRNANTVFPGYGNLPTDNSDN